MITKLRAAALIMFDGNMGQAMRALGLFEPNMSTIDYLSVLDDYRRQSAICVDLEGIDPKAVAEDVDSRPLDEPATTDADLVVDPDPCEHETIDPPTGVCKGCGEQMTPPFAAPLHGGVRVVGEDDLPPEPAPSAASAQTNTSTWKTINATPLNGYWVNIWRHPDTDVRGIREAAALLLQTNGNDNTRVVFGELSNNRLVVPACEIHRADGFAYWDTWPHDDWDAWYAASHPLHKDNHQRSASQREGVV